MSDYWKAFLFWNGMVAVISGVGYVLFLIEPWLLAAAVGLFIVFAIPHTISSDG